MDLMLRASLSIFILTAVAGCETFRGLGQDIENTGDNLKDLVGKAD